MSSHLIELLPAYALGCLDEEETLQASKHLSNCATCRAELRAYQAVVDQLPLGAREANLPPRIKKRLMAQLTFPSPSTRSLSSGKWWTRLGVFMHRRFPALAPVSLILIVALAIVNLLLWQELRQTQIATYPEVMRVVSLTATDAAPGAWGFLAISPDGQQASLVADGLPHLGPEWQYQLWLILDERQMSGGFFSVKPEGYSLLQVSSSISLFECSGFGVTVEPVGGSTYPTSKEVLSGVL